MNSKAFTLAEVLITLGIIGVVAAMTIPTLMQNTQNKETVTALKKVYSVLSQAYKLSEQENGDPSNWAIGTAAGDNAGAIELMNKITPYLSVTKSCVGDSSCLAPVVYKNLNDTTWFDNSAPGADVSSAILSDGSAIQAYTYGRCTVNRGSSLPLQNICGEYFVDVNGAKKPNKLGVDTFMFYVTTYGILPVGTAQQIAPQIFPSCLDHTDGRGCSAWVIYNENLDYLKCNTISWNGPKKCQ